MTISGIVVLEITTTQEKVTAKAVTHTVIVNTLMKTPTMAIFAEIPHPHEM